jgi:hypothetical protein
MRHKPTWKIRADIPADHLHKFDIVVIDPPFITDDVWRKYAQTAGLLLAKPFQSQHDAPETGGLVVGTTVFENAALMKELFGAIATPFLPSIPHLVYQYQSYTNFSPSSGLALANPEIPID